MNALTLSAEDTCECGHIRAGHAGSHGACLVYARREDIGKRHPRPCQCIGFARVPLPAADSMEAYHEGLREIARRLRARADELDRA